MKQKAYALKLLDLSAGPLGEGSDVILQVLPGLLIEDAFLCDHIMR